MPRGREFEPQDALRKAMETFWRNGYDQTSVDDLVAATGVSRYGLYGAFGDKRELFLASLDLYRDDVVTWLMRSVEAPGASLGAIHQYFTDLAAFASFPGGENGCLMCNTATDAVMREPGVAARVTTHFDRMASAFRRALGAARQNGEIPATFDIEACADYLVGVAQGVFVYARSPIERARIERFVRFALAALP